MMKKIVFATNNQHKLDEIRQILGSTFEVLSLNDIGCHEEIPEDHDTLQENALQKAKYIADHYEVDCFADDTGLEVEALNGEPGAYAYPFREFGEVVVSVIDAKKNQFFAAVYKNGECIFPAEDTTAEKISAFLKSTIGNGEKIIVVGPDAKIFSGELKENGIENAKFLSSQPNATDSLSEIAESMIEQKKEPLKDYDVPIYLRKSEAEIALENK